jgi:hypothetical protein
MYIYPLEMTRTTRRTTMGRLVILVVILIVINHLVAHCGRSDDLKS